MSCLETAGKEEEKEEEKEDRGVENRGGGE